MGSRLSKHWFTAVCPSHRMTQLQRCNPVFATPERCKDAKELKERLTSMVIESGRVRASIQSD